MGCYWHLEGREQGCCYTTYNAQDSPQNKELSSKNVKSARVPRLRNSALCSNSVFILKEPCSHHYTKNTLNKKTYSLPIQGCHIKECSQIMNIYSITLEIIWANEGACELGIFKREKIPKVSHQSLCPYLASYFVWSLFFTFSEVFCTSMKIFQGFHTWKSFC